VEKVLFAEEQRFTQKWLWLLIIGATLIAVIPTIYGIYSQEILGKAWGNNPTETGTLYLILILELVLMGGVMLLIYKMRLKVEIKSDGFWFSLTPLARKWRCIKKEEIAGFEVRTYRPVAEYGGWGIKGSSRNKAYNISGNVGLQLVLKNGRKVLFGTQESQAIEYAMRKMMNSERLK
jgi:hypothetical protein